ncbi:MAG: V-type ATP synthase subunit E [Clostridiales bacterium]|nr:V-type ATP synthase subunit E [Clostridiales bacterium]
MVTIEQKLSLFSKLLHRSMSDKFAEEMENLKKEYEEKIRKNRDEVDKEASDILNKSRKKAETEKIELISGIRITMKREYLSVKEKFFVVLMDHLKDEIEKFVQSEKYGEYLFSQVKKLESEQFSDKLIIHMTNRDYEKYAKNIKQELLKSLQKDLTFDIADDDIIGGFIAEDPVGNIRMNYSIDALLEDNKQYIMQTLFQVIEAGESDGIL